VFDLDFLLRSAAENVNLNPTRRERAEAAYPAIGDWLCTPGSMLACLNPIVYAQGSIPMDTAINPCNGTEFDVDGVVLMQLHPGITSDDARLWVVQRMSEHGTYRTRLEMLPRCIRIHYDDGFHVDLIPARPNGCAVDIPGAAVGSWERSDPEGYLSWFEASAQRSRVREVAKAYVEPLPAPSSPSEKPQLKLAVQLWKRSRDVYFGGGDFLPASMLLSTLAAEPYRGETSLMSILVAGVAKAAGLVTPGAFPYLENPTNPGENLARALVVDPSRVVYRREAGGRLPRAVWGLA
jgi:hypothetical protein